MSGDEQRDEGRGPRLIDLLALIVGFGTAALLLRSLWPATRSLSAVVAVVAGLLHFWLGLAMAGPLLLLLDRRGLNDATRQLSWAQVAWLLIGSYWLVVTALVVPSWMKVTPMFGVFPILAAVLLRVVSPRTPEARLRARSWTDRIAVGLMATWPLAWAALILLSKRLF